ncbi:MAG: helicase UvrD [Candidatus Pacearchaeota archaeon]|nr:MAG: helicase UvrD [Candidatus Pacearchaeota archaeon]
MEIIADLQIHSRYSRATSKDISIENLEKYARIKGLDLLGTGDFQHPLWKKEIDEKLIEDENGILRTETGFPFLWQTEVSLIYSQDGKRRAVHLLVFSPNRETSEKIIKYLSTKGRVDYDGRPIFNINSRDFVKELKTINDEIEIIPAHCMTPWFGLFGSKSGFNSIEECFKDQADKIHAIESGMSADPEMLWRLKEVASGKINIVSFSDAHSFWPWRIGREATIFEFSENKISYSSIIKAIRTGKGLKATIETPPEYGKYHWDGHRFCKFSSDPKKTKQLKGICPVCGKSLTIGVESRLEEISYKEKGFKPENSKEFYKILPLHELISLFYKIPLGGKISWEKYNLLIKEFGNEFNILLKASKEELIKKIDIKFADLIIKNRKGKIKVIPGYDGEYGKAVLEEEQSKLSF